MEIAFEWKGRRGLTDLHKARFEESSLSAGYADKSSLARYKELKSVFPNTLIFFRKMGSFYAFDDTAVVLNLLFGYCFHRSKGMLVTEVAEAELMFSKLQSRRLRYIVDEYGKTTFIPGKRFYLQKPLSYYEAHPKLSWVSKPKLSAWKESYSKHGGGWCDDVWAPGLPSSRFNKSRNK